MKKQRIPVETIAAQGFYNFISDNKDLQDTLSTCIECAGKHLVYRRSGGKAVENAGI